MTAATVRTGDDGADAFGTTASALWFFAVTIGFM